MNYSLSGQSHFRAHEAPLKTHSQRENSFIHGRHHKMNPFRTQCTTSKRGISVNAFLFGSLFSLASTSVHWRFCCCPLSDTSCFLTTALIFTTIRWCGLVLTFPPCSTITGAMRRPSSTVMAPMADTRVALTWHAMPTTEGECDEQTEGWAGRRIE